MQISVMGEQRVRVAPERAVAHLTVTIEGNDRSTAVAEATAAANGIKAELDALKGSAAVETFAIEPLRTWSWRPSERAAERFSANVEVRATFADFDALGHYAADVAGRRGVQLGWVEWALTDATADRLRDECIAGAVKGARERAEAMARAAGAGAIEITEIADPGMLAGPEMRMASAAAKGYGGRGMDAAEPVQIVPEELEIGAALQLRFSTRGGDR